MPIKKILKKIVKKNKDNYNDKSHYINLSLLTEEERELRNF